MYTLQTQPTYSIAMVYGKTAVVGGLTYLRIIVIVAFLFSPWKGREPVSISYCMHTRTVYATLQKVVTIYVTALKNCDKGTTVEPRLIRDERFGQSNDILIANTYSHVPIKYPRG